MSHVAGLGKFWSNLSQRPVFWARRMSSNFLFELEWRFSCHLRAIGGAKCPRDLRPHTYSIFGFSIKRKMDSTKEIGKTCHGLNSTYNALKPIHDKSVSTMVRATMVSMQHGLI